MRVATCPDLRTRAAVAVAHYGPEATDLKGVGLPRRDEHPVPCGQLFVLVNYRAARDEPYPVAFLVSVPRHFYSRFPYRDVQLRRTVKKDGQLPLAEARGNVVDGKQVHRLKSGIIPRGDDGVAAQLRLFDRPSDPLHALLEGKAVRVEHRVSHKSSFPDLVAPAVGTSIKPTNEFLMNRE